MKIINVIVSDNIIIAIFDVTKENYKLFDVTKERKRKKNTTSGTKQDKK